MDARRDVFQAIADPTRRAILVLIANKRMTPNAIAECFDFTRQSISRHLRILTECELVRRRQQGREIYYQVEPEAMKPVADFISPFQKLWDDRFNQLDKVLDQIKDMPRDEDSNRRQR